MTDYASIEKTLGTALPDVRFVAVSYAEEAPAGVPKFTGAVPSGCSFWRLAAQSDGFYTVPADHFNCQIGAYTHAIELPPDRQADLEQTLSFMSSIGYVRLEEVPSMPRLPKQPAVMYYAPLAKAVLDPDVVIGAGRPAALMRLQEAATRVGAASQLPLLGRPTCMALPAAIAHGSVMSTGCIGNRVYTDLGDDELYLMIPGSRMGEVVKELDVIMSANETLAHYHGDRRATIGSS